jgi:hypothetical protein
MMLRQLYVNLGSAMAGWKLLGYGTIVVHSVWQVPSSVRATATWQVQLVHSDQTVSPQLAITELRFIQEDDKFQTRCWYYSKCGLFN